MVGRIIASCLTVAMLAPSAHAAPSGPVVLSEFIFETAPFAQCHASTIAETTDGQLVAAWFGGTRESNPDVGIWVSRRVGDKWTAPVEVADGVQSAEMRYPCWNPVLFQPRKGPLLLFFKVGPNPRAWWGELLTSDDGGKTWTGRTKLADGGIGPVKNKPIELADGAMLCPSSTEHEGWRIHFERSSDLGKTWTRIGPINDGQLIGAIQPSILTLPGGKLLALGRSTKGHVWQAESADQGRTWNEMTLSPIPNPNSGTDAVTLADGRHLLIYNHTSKGRSPLNLAVSSDAKTWQAALVLENEPGEYSYPAIIQTADGLVHITYTWKRLRVKHVVIDPAKLKPRDFVDGKWPG